MAVSYVLIKRGTPGSPTSTKRWYAQTQAINEIDLDKIAEEVQYACSATKGDVRLILDGLINVSKQHLSKGEIVEFGEFGRFRMTIINTKPYIGWDEKQDEPKKFYPAPTDRAEFNTSKNISKVNIRFTPGRHLTLLCKTALYREVEGGSPTSS